MTPEKLILHHSLTPDGWTANWTAITRYHMSYAFEGEIITKEKATVLMAEGNNVKVPWRDNGYHFGIERITGIPQCMIGRTPGTTGAHCIGQNNKSLGLCFVGNFDLAPPLTEILIKGAQICVWLLNLYGLRPRDIYGHKEFANKSCPGEFFDIDEFKDMVRRRL